ncbi:frataxin [Robbsia andropogonis]|uniref:Iron-sulfur cluster assembly protein CyaY n=1 Tax=Robbsia andropogonis TaxID=28092 RepID=A0A0F5JXA8_9BURK|nr:iron donor protein CyaY [Robbsia andropogonis]KKB62264.1 frataxin [Robbsia andropogonis]MCP1120557.1 iron donor protein CyaY [Robbsia andropogonis]MCP1130518.1 iron donor protein CyaY [Robbsia andropogonis]
MTDTEYMARAEAVLAAIEQGADDVEADIECERSGNVLSLEFERGAKIIVNLQQPMHEIWIASKTGGYHFKFDGALWRDTRSGDEFFAVLSREATQIAGEDVSFQAAD